MTDSTPIRDLLREAKAEVIVEEIEPDDADIKVSLIHTRYSYVHGMYIVRNC